jgi:Glu-tRNA(Gln) amidotransferase subunit E-like FAD-binding protein
MKSFNINIRVSDDLKETVQYLKLLPGGITKYIETQLKKVKVDRDLMEKLKNM